MSEVLLLLGGNQGDKHKIFSETLKLINEKIGPVTSTSSIYETEPWGFVSDLFWNQALVVQTLMEPEDLLDCVLEIEYILGRKRINPEYEARPIDIDIMFYNNLMFSSPRLTIPHPLIPERKFVLVPLAEIAAERVHPTTDLTILEMLRICPDQLKVSRIKERS